MALQIIIVKAKGKNDFKGIIRCYEKKKNKWKDTVSCECVIGKKGIIPFKDKVEGDMATPSGVYTLGFVFGYDNKPNTKMEYIRLTDKDIWIDDACHPLYNQFVRGPVNAKSYEIMRRTDNLYKLGIVINYNREPVIKNKGSAIFIHIWEDKKTPTKGCIATDEHHIKSIIEWLNPDKSPLIIIKQP